MKENAISTLENRYQNNVVHIAKCLKRLRLSQGPWSHCVKSHFKQDNTELGFNGFSRIRPRLKPALHKVKNENELLQDINARLSVDELMESIEVMKQSWRLKSPNGTNTTGFIYL